MKVRGFLSSIVYSVSSYFFTSYGFSQSNLEGWGKEKKRKKKLKKGWFICSYYFDSEADFWTDYFKGKSKAQDLLCKAPFRLTDISWSVCLNFRVQYLDVLSNNSCFSFTIETVIAYFWVCELECKIMPSFRIGIIYEHNYFVFSKNF